MRDKCITEIHKFVTYDGKCGIRVLWQKTGTLLMMESVLLMVRMREKVYYDGKCRLYGVNVE